MHSRQAEVKSFTMPPSPAAAVTIKDVAQAAGISLAATSYALRNSPKISSATRDRVQTVARELGYRPNARVASLMAHIRRAHARPAHERLAFVWVHTSRSKAARDPFLRRVFRGARARAEQAGFALEEFWTGDAGMSDRRLEEILRARGIVGVVLSPVTTSEASLALEWDWSRFSAAVIGNVTWTPELHHAGHHHYLGMRMALLELAKLGCTRPAAIIETNVNERAKRAWEAAFLTHHPAASRARTLIRLSTLEKSGALAGWLQGLDADALLVSGRNVLDPPRVRALAAQRGLRLATLHWSADVPGLAGVDQCYDRVAAHAVDLVVAQLHNNECGAPELPSMMLFPGRWRPAVSPADRSA